MSRGSIEETDAIAKAIVSSVFKVRAELGAGLLEGVYQACLRRELEKRGHRVAVKVKVPIIYDGETLPHPLEIDLLVDELVVVEAKAVQELHPVFYAQTLTYLRLSGKRLGLLVNFNNIPLREGIHRLVL